MILLIYCIRKKKADRLEDDGKCLKALSSLQPPKILEVFPDSFPVVGARAHLWHVVNLSASAAIVSFGFRHIL